MQDPRPFVLGEFSRFPGENQLFTSKAIYELGPVFTALGQAVSKRLSCMTVCRRSGALEDKAAGSHVEESNSQRSKA